MLLRILFTLLLGSLGGWLFATIHSPLPWLLGALVTTVICNMLGVKNLWIPRWFRQAGLTVIGITLGLRMTSEIVDTMTGHVGLMLITTILTILISLVNAWIFYKICRVDGITAIFSNIPGGLSEMVSVGQMAGGNQQVITIFHSIRAISVVLCTPYLVAFLPTHATIQTATTEHVLGIGQTVMILVAGLMGALIASRCYIPAPFLLGALLVTALISMNTSLMGESPALPSILVQGAQIFIGVSIGLGFKREDIVKNRRFFLFGLMHSLFLFVMVIVLAIGISYVTATDIVTAILATVPGGLAEMSLTALATGADPLLVTAFHLFRLVLVLTLFSFGARAWTNYHSRIKQPKETSA
ncbi:AbrB family transcriptional regulator [Brevibacillus sp. HB1.3]|uniref:AbrB family transcriptional regulator n=1 Tax=Brevibacillus sp. HB1.3 TaxID=2738842 RepID=UPI001552E258|nr:AbrB family transcriptional regulator [Brevibacillus sp. HB1.3]NQF16072.1 AbrB family transcriptional regulator [Brevibacillus sp. HB1.3]